jgi:hypothetical protein
MPLHEGDNEVDIDEEMVGGATEGLITALER